MNRYQIISFEIEIIRKHRNTRNEVQRRNEKGVKLPVLNRTEQKFIYLFHDDAR